MQEVPPKWKVPLAKHQALSQMGLFFFELSIFGGEKKCAWGNENGFGCWGIHANVLRICASMSANDKIRLVPGLAGKLGGRNI